MLKKLIKWARISGAGDDTTQFPVQQIEFKGKTADCFMLFPYGLHGNVAKDALALVFSLEGDDSNRAAIAGTPANRPQMAEGENCIYHPPTGTIIHFRESGDIDVTSESAVNVAAPEVTIDGNLTVTGNLSVDGDAEVAGDTTLGSTVTSNGKNIGDTHTHIGSPTAPTGGISNTGFPI